MSRWTREHQALLTALRANAVVPPLVRRLSLERVSPDDTEIRRLRGWASALRADPGWEVLRHVTESPDAWPAIWDDAVAAGFSPASDHHHALLFGRFCERFVAAQDWEGASWTWRQGVDAWVRVFSTDYPAQLFEDLRPKLSDEGAGRDEMLRGMLDGLLEPRSVELREAAGLGRPGAPAIERRRLRFAWRALQHVGAIGDGVDDPFGTIARLRGQADEARNVVGAEVLGRFKKAVGEIDLSEATGDDLLGPFRWVASYFELTGYSESAVTAVVSTIVETCWGLRRVGRDERSEFAQLLELGKPFNENLFDRLTSFESAFGHNSRCADFLVFIGENQTGAPRRATFEAGLQVCPGHRNSAMLLSHEMIREASKLITQVAVSPTLAGKVPGTRNRLADLLRSANALLDEAEETYAYNESLPDARDSLETELRRLDVQLD